MKKIIVLLLILASVVCCFTACDNETRKISEGDEKTSTEQKPKTDDDNADVNEKEDNLIQDIIMAGVFDKEKKHYANEKVDIVFDFSGLTNWEKVDEDKDSVLICAQKVQDDAAKNNVLIGAYKTEMEPSDVIAQIIAKEQEKSEWKAEFISKNGDYKSCLGEHKTFGSKDEHRAQIKYIKSNEEGKFDIECVQEIIAYSAKVDEEKVIVLISITVDAAEGYEGRIKTVYETIKPFSASDAKTGQVFEESVQSGFSAI